MFNLKPKHRRSADGDDYVDTYTFTTVDVDCAAEKQYPDNSSIVRTTKEGVDGIIYQYRNKPPVFIAEKRVFGFEKENRKKAERQAYFALSMMDSRGCVSGWRKL